MIVVEIRDVLKERKAENTLDTKARLVTPADNKIVGNNKELDTIEPDTEINIPAEDNIKLIKFGNAAMDNIAVEDSKTVKTDPKLDMLAGNLNNTVLNKNKNAAVNKTIGIMKIELSSIDAGITAF